MTPVTLAACAEALCISRNGFSSLFQKLLIARTAIVKLGWLWKQIGNKNVICIFSKLLDYLR